MKHLLLVLLLAAHLPTATSVTCGVVMEPTTTFASELTSVLQADEGPEDLVVCLKPGSFGGCLDEGINLVAGGGGNLYIVGDTTDPSEVVISCYVSQPLFVMNNDTEVLIANILVRDVTGLNDVQGSAVRVAQGSLTLDNVVITKARTAAVYAHIGTRVAAYNSVFTDCVYASGDDVLPSYSGAVFRIKTAHLTLVDCELTLNQAYKGGTVFTDASSVWVANSTFSQNTATASGADISVDRSDGTFVNLTSTFASAGGSGACIAATYSDVNISHSYMLYPTAGSQGAVNVAGGNLVMINTSVVWCVALDGACVTAGSTPSEGGTSYIDGCLFGGFDTTLGYAVSLASDQNTVLNTRFERPSNIPSSEFGHLETSTPTTVAQCTFVDGNGRYGGGIYSSAGSLSVFDSSFLNNYAAYGGAIDNGEGEPLFVNNSVFADNTGTTSGGAVYGPGLLLLHNSTFVGNSGFDGGAVATTVNGVVVVTESFFAGNEADDNDIEGDGSALFFDGATQATISGSTFVNHNTPTTDLVFVDSNAAITWIDTNFADNTASSAMLLSGTGSSISGCMFARNTLQYGCLFGQFLDVTVSESVFEGNFGSGGAIYLINSAISVDSCVFAENQATLFGGAIVVTGLTKAVVSNSNFTNNVADSGGAIDVSNFALLSPGVNFTQCVFRGNSAGNGGAIYVSGRFTSVAVFDSLFVANTADVGAALFNLVDTRGTVTGSTFKDNVGAAGGVVFGLLALRQSLIDCAFHDNSPTAVFTFTGTTLSIERCVFTSVSGYDHVAGLGTTNIFISDSSLLVTKSGLALSLISCNTAIATNSILGSDTSASVVEVESSRFGTFGGVVCNGGFAQPLTCRGSWSTFGGVANCGSGMLTGEPCVEICGKESTCLPESTLPNAPNLGCPVCGGECATDADECVENTTYCYDEPSGGYDCGCRVGFGNLEGYGCSDINECADNNNICSGLSKCVNTFGSFFCECPVGYDRSSGGNDCVDIDECLQVPCGGLPHQCINTVGSYMCECDGDAYVYGGSTECRFCTGGYYVLNNVACIKCAAGYVNNITSATSCVACDGDRETANTDQTACVCEPGFEYGESDTCLAECGPGQRRVADLTCQDCGFGFYGDGAGGCLQCPLEGMTTPTANATSVSDCVCGPSYMAVNTSFGIECVFACGPGYYVAGNGDTCVTCASGEYSDTFSDATACTPCPLPGMVSTAPPTSVDSCMCPPGLGPENGFCTTYCPPGQARPVDVDDCEMCGKGEYSVEANQRVCNVCPTHSTCPPQSTSINDCTCRNGFYDPQRRRGVACNPCPRGATCPGGTRAPVPNEGYAEIDGVVVECVPAEACSGSNNCGAGYEGSGCSSCSPGYHREAGYCRKCGALTLIGLLFGVFGSIALCIGVFVFNLYEGSVSRASAFVIGLNTLQIVALFGRLNIAWPAFVQRLFDVLATFNFNIEIIAPECAVTVSDPFLMRFLASMFVPVWLAAASSMLARSFARTLAPTLTCMHTQS